MVFDAARIDLTGCCFDSSFRVRSAATVPPIFSICANSSLAACFSSATLAAMAGEPSGTSPYSSRSVSYARIPAAGCAATIAGPDGPRRPSASFQAGGPRARARPLRQGEAIISMRMRATLFLACCSVSPGELTCTAEAGTAAAWHRSHHRARGWISSHSSVNARSLQTSVTKRRPALTKNEMRPTTSPNSSGAHWPDFLTASSTPMPVASAKASSCTGVAPASCRW